MIEDHIKLLAKILTKFATNSERQAMDWAYRIDEELGKEGYCILETDRDDEEIPF